MLDDFKEIKFDTAIKKHLASKFHDKILAEIPGEIKKSDFFFSDFGISRTKSLVEFYVSSSNNPLKIVEPKRMQQVFLYKLKAANTGVLYVEKIGI